MHIIHTSSYIYIFTCTHIHIYICIRIQYTKVYVHPHDFGQTSRRLSKGAAKFGEGFWSSSGSCSQYLHYDYYYYSCRELGVWVLLEV